MTRISTGAPDVADGVSSYRRAAAGNRSGRIPVDATGNVRNVSEDEEIVLEGVVVTGDRRGRLLGFPTANVELPAATQLPADGVYAGWFERPGGERYVAAVSVGTRPTYYREGGGRLVEAYLLDFDGDLYGEQVRVGVGAMVRGQGRFAGSEELIAQMQRDVDAVRTLTGP
jgi:riboflavin kinase/FMN adenylyltransferase